MRKWWLFFLGILLVLMVMFTGCSVPPIEAQQQLDIGKEAKVGGRVTLQSTAGTVGGAWYLTMASLAELIMQNDPNIQIRTVPGGGISNSAKIGRGDVQIGWVYPPFAKLAYEGKNPYDQPYTALRAIANGFSPNVLEFAVTINSKINSMEEIFRDKRPVKFLTGKKDTTTGFFFDVMLGHFGVSRQDIESWGGKVIYTTYSDWAQLIKDGHCEAMWNQTAIPSPTTVEIAVSTDLKLLPLPESLRQMFIRDYAFEETVIPVGTYSWLKEDIATVKLTNTLAVHKDVPDEIVYKILSIIDANLEKVKAIHPSWKEFNMNIAWKNTGVPLHPGAEKYYKEKGYIK